MPVCPWHSVKSTVYHWDVGQGRNTRHTRREFREYFEGSFSTVRDYGLFCLRAFQVG